MARLDEFREQIGWPPLLFGAVAFVALAFAAQVPDDSPRTKSFSVAVAATCFGLAIIAGTLRLTTELFRKRPARGIIDGLSAGLIAGVVGGYFGWGFHDYWYQPGYDPWPHADSRFVRVGFCIMFAVPIGAVLGAIMDLVHPDRKLDWRKHLGPVSLVLFGLVTLVAMGIYLFSPDVDGPGIIVSDIQLLFEVYLITISIILSISIGWPLRRIAARLPIVLVVIALTRLPTFIFKTDDPDQEGVRWYNMRFIYDQPTDTTDRISGAQADWAMNEAILVVCLMLWTVATYTAFHKDHRVTRWIDRRIGGIHD